MHKYKVLSDVNVIMSHFLLLFNFTYILTLYVYYFYQNVYFK